LASELSYSINLITASDACEFYPSAVFAFAMPFKALDLLRLCLF